MEQRLIVLASGSPRRKELLEKVGLVFKVDPSELTEPARPDLKPLALAKFISLSKASAVASRYPDAIVIAADTFGVLRGKILGKPQSEDEARSMLTYLSGISHLVITGFTIIDTRSGKSVTRTVETRVFIRKLSPGEIDNYIKSGEPLDKAGAYAVQGLGSLIVDRIEGDYYNVVGLPLCELSEALKTFGVNIL